MRQPLLALILLVVRVSAQPASSSDLFSILVSEGLSVFNSVTSALGTATSTSGASSTSDTTSSSASAGSLSPPFLSTAASITSTSSSRTRQSQSTASSSASSFSSSSAVSSPTQTSSNTSGASSSGTAAAAASATSSTASAASSGGHSNRDRTLAIVLGTVLGALALGLLLLLLLILCRRRKRRAAAKNGSLYSSSDEALAGQKAGSKHVTPVAAAAASRRPVSLNRRSTDGMPLMSERSTVDVPSAHTFQDGSTAPFLPTGGARRSSGILPSQTGESVANSGHLYDGRGLDRHHDQGDHHAGSVLAAGAGGAALGAAAARHSGSKERRHDPRSSGDPEVHPDFWEGPPPRSPHRNSTDNVGRRSGSMPRGRFYAPQDQTGSPLRNGTSAAATSALAGGAVGAETGNTGHRSRDRGRTHPTDPPPYDWRTNGAHPAAPRGVMTGVSDTGVGVPYQSSAMPVPPPDRRSMNSGDRRIMLPAGLASQSRSRSRSQNRPPLPPALMIPNPNTRRNMPSRSPKRTRFVNGETAYEPIPTDHNRMSNTTASPPLTSKSNSWHSFGNPETTANDDLVSPVSPEELGRGSIGHNMPMAGGTTFPRSRSPSPDRYSRPHNLSWNAPTATTTSQPTPNKPIKPNYPRQHSGLVNTIEDHFNQPQPQNPNYQAYTAPETIRPSAFPPKTTASNRSPGPVSRKPVPQSVYNNAMPSSHIGRGNGTDGDQSWRGEEDSAWAESYSRIGEAR